LIIPNSDRKGSMGQGKQKIIIKIAEAFPTESLSACIADELGLTN
jgi:hypothetical protein